MDAGHLSPLVLLLGLNFGIHKAKFTMSLDLWQSAGQGEPNLWAGLHVLEGRRENEKKNYLY